MTTSNKLHPAISQDIQERIGTLIQQLGNDVQEIHIAATHALTDIGQPAVLYLKKALHSPNARIRSGAAYTLYMIGKPAPLRMPALVEALRDPVAWKVRTSAALALGEIGEPAPAAVRGLVEALGDRYPLVAAAAAAGLRMIATAAPEHVEELAREAVSALVRAIRHPIKIVGQAAADALAEFGEFAREAVPTLVDALGHADDRLRPSAARALGRIAPPDPAVADALLAAAHDKADGALLCTVCEAVVKITQALKHSHKATFDKTRLFLRKVRDSRFSDIVRIQANMRLEDLHTKDNADIPLVVDATDSTWPALTDGELCGNFKALHITYLAHRINQREPEQSFSCKDIAAELKANYGFQDTDETVRTCLRDAQDLFIDHFKKPDFLLFDMSRRGVQFLPVDATREHTDVWEFLDHLFGRLPTKPAGHAGFNGKIDKR